MIKYLSVCSGIEAATVAWHPLGWEAVAYSEIEYFPSEVLNHHYPDVPNHGDMTKFKDWPDADVDVLVGGTPCQSFSIAGFRKGLADPRGNLALTFLAILDRYRPHWVLWENVPGVLSSSGGRDFGAFLGGLGQLGYGWGYRVLDAQYFGVPQRRRRVFVVGYLGDWRPPAAVLFERESLQGHPAPRQEAGKGFTHTVAPSLTSSGRGVERVGESRGQDPVIAMCLNGKGASGRMDGESETFVTHSLRGEGFDASEDGTGRGTPLVTLDDMAVRRLTPRECERLQELPDDYTLIPLTRGQRRAVDAEMATYYQRTQPELSDDIIRRLAKDGPRYKAIGNSMAVPVMRWLGERIMMVEDLIKDNRP